METPLDTGGGGAGGGRGGGSPIASGSGTVLTSESVIPIAGGSRTVSTKGAVTTRSRGTPLGTYGLPLYPGISDKCPDCRVKRAQMLKTRGGRLKLTKSVLAALCVQCMAKVILASKGKEATLGRTETEDEDYIGVVEEQEEVEEVEEDDDTDDGATIISEIPGEGVEVSGVGGVLRYCKRRVLRPYFCVLGVIGLNPFVTRNKAPLRLLNKAYVLFVLLLVLTGHCLHFYTCYRRDKGLDYIPEVEETFEFDDGILPLFNTSSETSSQFSSTTVDPTFAVNVTGNRKKRKSSFNVDVRVNSALNTTTTASPLVVDLDSSTIRPVDEYQPIRRIQDGGKMCVGNLVFVQCVPSAVHFCSFLYMIYLYWVNHDEQLQSLMERVFLQATHAHSTLWSQKKILKTLKLLVWFGFGWLLFSITCFVFQMLSKRVFFKYLPSLGLVERNVLKGVMGVGTVLQDAIQVTVIISYCIHCNLLCTYLDFIYARVHQHSITLPECMKEIGELSKLLTYINDCLASGVLPLVIVDSVYLLGSLADFVAFAKPWQDLIVSGAVCILWLSVVAVPVSNAVKLSKRLKKIRDLGHFVRMRPFGYKSYKQADLDSFLLFIATFKMDVRMLNISLTATKVSSLIFCALLVVFVWGYFFSDEKTIWLK